MGKKALMGTSLVAAIPAGFLVFLMVQVFLTQTENMATIMYVIAGLTLAVGSTVALMPIGILLFTASSPKQKPKSDDAGDETGEAGRAESIAAETADADELDDEDFGDAGDDEYEFEDDDEEDWE